MFFTCNYCGERMKRLDVHKHYDLICKNKKTNVCCDNCLKTYGKTFKEHAECFLADRKIWMNIIHSVLDYAKYQLSPELRDAFYSLKSVDDVPCTVQKLNSFACSMRIPRNLTVKMWIILKKGLDEWVESKSIPDAEVPPMNKSKQTDTEHRALKYGTELSFRCNICTMYMLKSAISNHYHLECQVEAKNVTCLNCLKTYNGESYVGHMNCVPVELKEHLKKEKAEQKKRRLNIINAILNSTEYELPPQLRDAFQRLQSIGNVPREKAIFNNIVCHSLKISEAQGTEMWSILQRELGDVNELGAKANLVVSKAAKQEVTRTEAEETVPRTDESPLRTITVLNLKPTPAEETVAIVLSFKCNLCEARVKRLDVEEHYDLICRNATKSVSCMRCLKTFNGNAYKRHVGCTSVNEKTWMDIIRSVTDNTENQLSPKLKNAFQRIPQIVDKAPQKRIRFIKFMIHCVRMTERQAIEMWNILQRELEKFEESCEAAGFSVRKQMQSEESETVPEANVSSMRTIMENRKATLTETEGKVPETVPPVKRIKLELEESTPAEESVIEADVPSLKRIKLELEEAKPAEESVIEADVSSVKRFKMEKAESTTISDPKVPAMKTIKLEKLEAPQAETEAATAAATEETDDFDWAAEFTKLVVKQPDGIVLKKLKKKLARKYCKQKSVAELNEQQSKKFDKRFNKQLRKLRMEGELIN